MLHRFLFHMDSFMPHYSIFCFMHFLFHGVHHLLPMDRYRLVFPPALGIPLFYAVRAALKSALSFIPEDCYQAVVAGCIIVHLWIAPF